MKKAIILSLCALSAFGAGAQQAEWQDLFDGKTLTGWKQLGGNATFEVRNGEIVGTTAPNTPNSFLVTEKEYGNFILEFEFLTDPGLNSGVQFRSRFIDGLVRGTQYEIDPDVANNYSALPANLDQNGNAIAPGTHPRSWTAGIYDEKRRGWIGDLSGNPEARAAFRSGEWNTGRIEAKNDVIRTWINGVPAADIVDYTTPNGFFGLQVHAVPEYKKMEVRFRNIRIQDLGLNEEPGDTPDPFMSEWRDQSTGYLAQIWYDMKNSVYKVNVSDQPYKNIAPLVVLEAEEKGDELHFANTEGYKGSIVNKRLVITGPDGFRFTGQKFTRRPPTLGAPVPDGGIALFDGTGMEKWGSLAPKEWVVSNGEAADVVKMVPGGRFEIVPGNQSIITKDVFGDCRLHVEFRLLGEQTNGGVYLQSRYEFNIKDSYGMSPCSTVGQWGNVAKPEYPNTEYNYALPPMVWQTMDIDFTAPRFDAAGNKTANAKATMYLNGELIYKDAEVESLKGAGGRLGEAPLGPVYLQEHGTAYQFRNIWIVPQPEAEVQSGRRNNNRQSELQSGSSTGNRQANARSASSRARGERKPANRNK